MEADDHPEGAPLPEDRKLPSLPAGEHVCDVCEGTGRVHEPVPAYPGYGGRGHLERGWRRQWLIRQLATGEFSKNELARIMRAHRQSIRDFEIKHQAEIESMIRQIDQEFAGLWVAEKVNRLAEYQQDVEDANEIIAGELGDPTAPPQVDPLDPGGLESEQAEPAPSAAPTWVRIKHAALKAVAEELGQIPNRVRMDIGGQVATYRIEGVDLDQV